MNKEKERKYLWKSKCQSINAIKTKLVQQLIKTNEILDESRRGRKKDKNH